MLVVNECLLVGWPRALPSAGPPSTRVGVKRPGASVALITSITPTFLMRGQTARCFIHMKKKRPVPNQDGDLIKIPPYFFFIATSMIHY